MINRPSGTAEGIAYMRYYESLRPAAPERPISDIYAIAVGYKN